MKKLILLISVTAILTAVGITANAEIDLPNLISDHMMIQRDETIKLWGTANAGANVTAKLLKESTVVAQGSAEADESGRFDIVLDAVSDKGPYTLEFSDGESSKTVNDVLAGDIWLQSGQSNMELTVDHCYPNTTEDYIADITQDITQEKPTEENIRLFYDYRTGLSFDERQTDLEGEWKVVNYENVLRYSAVGYSALNKLHKELDIPQGGICSPHGGAAMVGFQGPRKQGLPGNFLYNYKIAPVTQMNIKGVMWYQGESDQKNRFAEYDFSTSILKRWRADFGDEDMPFIYVSFPASPLRANFDLSKIRQVLLDAYYNEENVAMAVCVDLVGKSDDIHPGNKRPVGERMALAALGTVYKTEQEYSSPFFESIQAVGNVAVIKTSHAYSGLKTTDGEAPRMFRVAGDDGIFYDAAAVISGKDTITLRCPMVNRIKTVSYAVENNMFECDDSGYVNHDIINNMEEILPINYMNVNLVNSIDLPLCPFVYDVNTAPKTAK